MSHEVSGHVQLFLMISVAAYLISGLEMRANPSLELGVLLQRLHALLTVEIVHAARGRVAQHLVGAIQDRVLLMRQRYVLRVASSVRMELARERAVRGAYGVVTRIACHA